MASPVIGLQLYTVRDFMQDPAQTTETLKKVADIGYPAVEPAGFGGMQPAEFRAACDQAGLEIIACHGAWDEMRDDIDTVIARMQTLGATMIASGSPGEYQNGPGYAKFAQETSEIGKKLLAAGIKYQYHNHHHEYAHFDGKTAMEIMEENSDPESFFFQLDVHWVQRGGAGPVDWIHMLTGRIASLHCKDMGISPEREPLWEPVGMGNLNWDAILDAAESTGVDCFIVEQDRCQLDVFESIKISYDNLSEWLGV